MPESRPAASVRSAANVRSALAPKRRMPGPTRGQRAIPDLVLEQPAGDQRLRPKRLRGRAPFAQQLGKRHGAVEKDQRSSRSRSSACISSSKGTIGRRGGGSVAGSAVAARSRRQCGCGLREISWPGRPAIRPRHARRRRAPHPGSPAAAPPAPPARDTRRHRRLAGGGEQASEPGFRLATNPR
jgi:hypothetical protein